MTKLDLKDAYFCVPVHKESRKFVRFQWDEKLYWFFYLCFGLGPAPRIFMKLFKVPLAVLRKLNLLIIIYIDDMLIIGWTRKEVELTRDTLIYLLQHLGFVLNLKKFVLQPCQKIEFLGLIVNSVNLTLSLSLKRCRGSRRSAQRCAQELDIDFGIDQTFRSLVIIHPSSCTSSLTNSESSTVPDTVLKLKKSFQMNVKLTALGKEELLWRILNLQHSNRKLCIQNHLNQVIQTDASKKGWGAVCKWVQTGNLWSKEEQLLYINVVELLTTKLALLTFTKSGLIKSIHFQIDTKTAISYLLKMEGT